MANKEVTWHFDYLQLSAVVLVIAVSWGLNWLAVSPIQAENVAGDQTGAVLQVELPATQPTQIVQLEDQWIARFKLSTESVDPVIVKGLVFWLQGTLQTEVLRYPGLFPLELSSIDDATISGKGEIWKYIDGYIVQEVLFDQPIKVSFAEPIQIDVHMDLQHRYQDTVGVWLAKVLSVAPAQGLPIQSILLEVEDRL